MPAASQRHPPLCVKVRSRRSPAVSAVARLLEHVAALPSSSPPAAVIEQCTPPSRVAVARVAGGARWRVAGHHEQKHTHMARRRPPRPPRRSAHTSNEMRKGCTRGPDTTPAMLLARTVARPQRTRRRRGRGRAVLAGSDDFHGSRGGKRTTTTLRGGTQDNVTRTPRHTLMRRKRKRGNGEGPIVATAKAVAAPIAVRWPTDRCCGAPTEPVGRTTRAAPWVWNRLTPEPFDPGPRGRSEPFDPRRTFRPPTFRPANLSPTLRRTFRPRASHGNAPERDSPRFAVGTAAARRGYGTDGPFACCNRSTQAANDPRAR